MFAEINYIYHYKKIIEEKKTFEKFAFDFSSTYNDFLKRLKGFDNNSTDYLIIIGFNDDRTNAWIRCLSIKDNRLLAAESGIKGSSINEIAKKISVTDEPVSKMA